MSQREGTTIPTKIDSRQVLERFLAGRTSPFDAMDVIRWARENGWDGSTGPIESRIHQMRRSGEIDVLVAGRGSRPTVYAAPSDVEPDQNGDMP